MKIKAFTLVEVLVVIVIIGVIMLITRPIAISIFENAKEKTFSVMVEKIADAGENYITDYEVEYGRTLSNTVIEITDTQQNDNILRLNGDLPESAVVSVEDGQISVAIYDDGMCGIKLKNDSKASIFKSSKDDCNIESIYTYRIFAEDITIYKGTSIDLLENVIFKHENENINTVISYDSANFDYNRLGSYKILYTTSYNDRNYTTVRTINVIDDLFVLKDGTEVYYDVETGKLCSNYHTDNSLIGYNGIGGTGNQTSCLKFYAFGYVEGETVVNLLLDHNTTDTVYWKNSENESNESGPEDVLNQLKIDTDEWKGTMTPADYEVNQTTGGKYKIEYGEIGLKARLITAKEISEIVNHDSFNESKTGNANYFYFDSLTTSAADDCKSGDTTGCDYGWLYDRTLSSCITYGCFNNSNSGIKSFGYWTATSAYGTSNYAWYVHSNGRIGGNRGNTNNLGVRPVIEVGIEIFDNANILTIDPNEGVYGNGLINRYVVLELGTSYSLDTPKKGENYFDSWVISEGSGNIDGMIYTMSSRNTVLTAKYSEFLSSNS